MDKTIDFVEHSLEESDKPLTRQDLLQTIQNLDEENLWDIADFCQQKIEEYGRWRDLFLSHKWPDKFDSLVNELSEHQLQEFINVIDGMIQAQEVEDLKKLKESFNKAEGTSDIKILKAANIIKKISDNESLIRPSETAYYEFDLGQKVYALGGILFHFEKLKNNPEWKYQLAEKIREVDLDGIDSLLDTIIEYRSSS